MNLHHTARLRAAAKAARSLSRNHVEVLVETAEGAVAESEQLAEQLAAAQREPRCGHTSPGLLPGTQVGPCVLAHGHQGSHEDAHRGRWSDTPSAQGFPVVTICGSMKFYDRMLEVAQSHTSTGFIVLMPHDASLTGIANKDATKQGRMLDEMHRAKIRMSGSIYVVNTDGYIGESTAREIAYATELGLPIAYDFDDQLAETAA